MSALFPGEAAKVLAILSDTCWTSLDVRAGAEFVVNVQRDDFTEYRFQGDLGFGGKFYSAHGKWRVACYPEDRTPERDEAINQANVHLETLRGKCRGRG